jgi:hypothetical protein
MKPEPLLLYIPTRGRIDYQHTMRNLPDVWKRKTIIVCPKEEVKAHKKNWPMATVIAQPIHVQNIAQKRAWIFKHANDNGIVKIMMLDDDLRFSVRIKTLKEFKGYDHDKKKWKRRCAEQPGLHKLTNVNGEDPRLMNTFNAIERMLDVYKHGGISTRFHNQEFGCEFALNGRVQYALAYHVPTMLGRCKLARIGHREDFDYTLQLLCQGFENAVYCWTVVEQARGFGASGGMEGERTIARSNADAVRLAKLFPGIVTVTEKAYKSSIPRKEVIVKWKQAIELGRTGLI